MATVKSRDFRAPGHRVSLILVFTLIMLGAITRSPARSPDSYEVFAIPKEYPDDGPRNVETDPALDGAEASPYGWHDTDGQPGAEFTTTQGNNVHAYTDVDADNMPDPGGSPDGGPALEFIFPLDLESDPADYRPASVTNGFYWFNVAHDVLYGYGFDESAGNFQENNYGRGGLGGDGFLLEVQEGLFTNGATVSIPPDGERPRVQLGVFTLTNPRRDSALSSYILVHLYARGVAGRLVGGPEDTDCLLAEESSGMWIGWSDWVALVLTADSSETATTSRGVGTYVLGQPPSGPGFRDAPYTTDLDVNPLTYDDIKTLNAPFGVGAVWASLLWEVYWNLVESHGFNEDIYGDWTAGGNNLALQLIVDGMKLLPCSPGFVDGRDAILQADEMLTGGANRCDIWRGFAKRGLGVSADQGSAGSKSDGIEAFDLPPECEPSSLPEELADSDPMAGVHLYPSAPNPFKTGTSLLYSIPEKGKVRLAVYDVGGRKIATLIDGDRLAGEHTAAWPGRFDNGGYARPGVYFIRLIFKDEIVSRKIVMRQ